MEGMEFGWDCEVEEGSYRKGVIMIYQLKMNKGLFKSLKEKLLISHCM